MPIDDEALLELDCDLTVSLNGVDDLSPAQLAVASLRPDLDSLIRSRAYHEFLLRRDEYAQGFGAETKQGASSLLSVVECARSPRP